MTRKRFTAAERAAFTVGAAVQWRNGRHWHPAIIGGSIERVDGWDRIPVRAMATRGVIRTGDLIFGSPGAVRTDLQPAPPTRHVAMTDPLVAALSAMIGTAHGGLGGRIAAVVLSGKRVECTMEESDVIVHHPVLRRYVHVFTDALWTPEGYEPTHWIERAPSPPPTNHS